MVLFQSPPPQPPPHEEPQEEPHDELLHEDEPHDELLHDDPPPLSLLHEAEAQKTTGNIVPQPASPVAMFLPSFLRPPALSPKADLYIFWVFLKAAC